MNRTKLCHSILNLRSQVWNLNLNRDKVRSSRRSVTFRQSDFQFKVILTCHAPENTRLTDLILADDIRSQIRTSLKEKNSIGIELKTHYIYNDFNMFKYEKTQIYFCLNFLYKIDKLKIGTNIFNDFVVVDIISLFDLFYC